MTVNLRSAALVAAICALNMSPAHAQSASSLPPVHHFDKIEYLSGGIGQDESEAIKTEGKKWPLTMEFYQMDGQHAVYTANAKILVTDAMGRKVLTVTSDGPFMLAKLPAKKYSIEATMGGVAIKKTAILHPQHMTKVTFLWKQALTPK